LLVTVPVVIYVTLLLMITLMKEALVYPGVSMYQHLKLEDPTFTNAVQKAGVEIWQTPSGKYLGLKRTVPEPTMRWVIFYGNGDVGLRATGWFETLQRQLVEHDCDFYVMDYPGYGPQPGKPGEQAIVDLAREAATTIPDDGLPLYFLGQSMGSGVSCRLIKEPEWKKKVSGLLLVNPYTSLTGASHQYLKGLVGPFYRLFPVGKILQDRYDSINNIQEFTGRVVIIAGEKDGLTPAWMAQELQQQVSSKSRLWVQKGVGHYTVPEPYEKWQELMDYLTQKSPVTER